MVGREPAARPGNRNGLSDVPLGGGRPPRRARGDSGPESLESAGGHASNMMYVAPSAVLVGDVTVEEGASVWHGAVLRGDFDSIVVGEDSNVQDNVGVHVERGLLAP